MTILQEIENKAFALPLSEKGKLIHDLIVNNDDQPEYSVEFEKEIQRRITKIRSGTAGGTPAADVFSKIEAKYRLLQGPRDRRKKRCRCR